MHRLLDSYFIVRIWAPFTSAQRGPINGMNTQTLLEEQLEQWAPLVPRALQAQQVAQELLEHRDWMVRLERERLVQLVVTHLVIPLG